VAWRSHDLVADPVGALREVLTEILRLVPAKAEARIETRAHKT
jgi:predicted Co/Zn/Cd cation transporter (cation efflux family)